MVGGGRRVMVLHDVHLSHNFIDIFSDVWPQKKACSSVLVEGNTRVFNYWLLRTSDDLGSSLILLTIYFLERL